MIEVDCWAHARRKFFEIAQQSEQGLSPMWPWSSSADSGIERETKALELDAEGIRSLRQEKVLPILDSFKAWLEQRLREPAPETTKGVDYALKNRAALLRYTEDGRLAEHAAPYQGERVADARGLPRSQVESLIKAHPFAPGDARIPGRLINVLELNLALDQPLGEESKIVGAGPRQSTKSVPKRLESLRNRHPSVDIQLLE